MSIRLFSNVNKTIFQHIIIQIFKLKNNITLKEYVYVKNKPKKKSIRILSFVINTCAKQCKTIHLSYMKVEKACSQLNWEQKKCQLIYSILQSIAAEHVKGTVAQQIKKEIKTFISPIYYLQKIKEKICY